MFDLKGNTVQDVKSGENVERHKVPEEMDKAIIALFTQHGAINTEMAGRLEQVLIHIKNGLELLDKKIKQEESIKEQMKNVCRTLQLNEVEPWGYNFQEHSMEKRTAPALGAVPAPPPPPPAPPTQPPSGGGQPNG